ncbi:MAG: ribosome biogenesis protein [Candidatus Aenigmarchaeota archaeon]|nr:ribosome biogenesis protein [Candidatus Aenigmarchaeota archaeon]OYT58270.1 MAG: ribosome biogenesis protein [Candidatus Aenigmarchaeota archaeon ex4484_14]RLI97424.1 MAG: ribosome biogenesis protein [Candidatus Aenigmarchaeota archaeon]
MLLRKCPRCGSYSLRDKCEKCDSVTRNPHPPKFSITDKYAKYRQKAKMKI